MANAAAVVVGSLIGLLLKKGISDRIHHAVMTALGLCTVYIGISGALDGQNVLVLVSSMVLGTVVGSLLDIDGKLLRFGQAIELCVRRPGNGGASVVNGFVTATLLFCVGAMTVVGSLQAGLSGDYEMLFTKSMLDFVSAMMLSAALGVGVLLSAGSIFLIQGAIALLAQVLQPLLSDWAVAEIGCAGSVMIIAIGLNMIGLTKIKVANFTPALLIAPIICFVVLRFA